ncbi:hypothetical protein KEM48_001104 [Puccinia striiformis f. sp. tritici PST-130]|nr:hypothetical protein H4Q26_000877 [Puccinia striiformis f. sp. tritici PST-130]KAI9601818.1 hypothetical protein KEM48_001104 [Puccinia striiformis f. sp. tritici PST-130]
MSFEFSQNSDDVTLTDNHGAMSTGDGENPDKDDNLSAQIKSLVAAIGAMASTAEGVDSQRHSFTLVLSNPDTCDTEIVCSRTSQATCLQVQKNCWN